MDLYLHSRNDENLWTFSCVFSICRLAGYVMHEKGLITLRGRNSSLHPSVKTVFGLTFIVPCNANIFADYNQQDGTFLNLFISVRRSTCFRRFFRPSPGAQNFTYSVRYLSDRYCYLLLAWLYVQFWAPGDGRKNRLKHVERLTEINKLRNVPSCWLYSANFFGIQFILLYNGCWRIVALKQQRKCDFAVSGLKRTQVYRYCSSTPSWRGDYI